MVINLIRLFVLILSCGLFVPVVNAQKVPPYGSTEKQLRPLIDKFAEDHGYLFHERTKMPTDGDIGIFYRKEDDDACGYTVCFVISKKTGLYYGWGKYTAVFKDKPKTAEYDKWAWEQFNEHKKSLVNKGYKMRKDGVNDFTYFQR